MGETVPTSPAVAGGALGVLAGRFGSVDPKKSSKYLDVAMSTQQCLTAMATRDANAMIGQCITSDWFKAAFGLLWGELADAIMKVSEVANYFRSALNGVTDIVNGRSNFQITVSHANAAIGTFTGLWTAHERGLCIGSPPDLAANARHNGLICTGSGSVGYALYYFCRVASYQNIPICYEWSRRHLLNRGYRHRLLVQFPDYRH